MVSNLHTMHDVYRRYSNNPNHTQNTMFVLLMNYMFLVSSMCVPESHRYMSMCHRDTHSQLHMFYMLFHLSIFQPHMYMYLPHMRR